MLAAYGVVGSVVLTGCAIDNRFLLADDLGPEGGATGATAGTAGVAPTPVIDLPICDYAGEVSTGCETIVSNAGFAEGIEGWEAEPYAIVTGWDALDASGSAASGSIVVVNALHGTEEGVASGGAWQCLPAPAGALYGMAGDIFIPEGQGTGLAGGPYVGKAALSVFFWENDQCVGRTKGGNFVSTMVEEVGTWTHVEGQAQTPEGVASMSMRVITVKPFREFNFKAQFDNLLLKRP